MIRTVTAFLAVLLLAWPAGAQTQSGPGKADRCATAAIVRRDVAAFPFPAVATELTAAQTQAFLARLNALPPQTNLRADFIIVVTAESKPQVVLALFEKGCVVRTIYVPRKIFNQAMGVET